LEISAVEGKKNPNKIPEKIYPIIGWILNFLATIPPKEAAAIAKRRLWEKAELSIVFSLPDFFVKLKYE
jgi:hypothetical protein